MEEDPIVNVENASQRLMKRTSEEAPENGSDVQCREEGRQRVSLRDTNIQLKRVRIGSSHRIDGGPGFKPRMDTAHHKGRETLKCQNRFKNFVPNGGEELGNIYR